MLFFSFQGNKLIVRAIRDVQEGDEVFNCYGPHYRRMRRSERLEVLEAQYCFNCTCDSCLDTNTEDFQVFAVILKDSAALFILSYFVGCDLLFRLPVVPRLADQPYFQ